VERLFRAAVSSLVLLFLAVPGHAQSPPPPVSQPFPGFVSPYEVMRMVHASGFDPLAPPLREGTTYVLRVTDFRGILMRVVVDGRTGAFREVTRIVPGPGRYGQFYGAPPYGAPPYGPPEYDAAIAVPSEVGVDPPLVRPTAVHPAPTATVPAAVLPPPLPRPRPAALASRSAVDAKPAVSSQPASSPKAETKMDAKTNAKTETTTNAAPSASPTTSTTTQPSAAAPANNATITKPAGPSDGKPQVNSEVITAAPPPAAAPKKSAIPAEPLND
jgi:hypothetical protein